MEDREYILLMADIHANFAALQTVLADARVRYPAGQYGRLKIWFLGDLFGRGPAPVQVWDWLVDTPPEAVIVGNHDWGLIGRHEDIKVQVSDTPPEWKWHGLFDGDDWEIILEHRQQLKMMGLLTLDTHGAPTGGEVFEQLKNWPGICIPRPGIYLVHGGLEKRPEPPISLNDWVWGYVKKPEHVEYTLTGLTWLSQNWSERPELQAALGALQPPKLVFIGHYHRRTLYFADTGHWEAPVKLDQPYLLPSRLERPILISPGGVGFPREEDRYDKDASYAVLYLEKQRPQTVIFHKTSFNRKQVMEQMQQHNYSAKIWAYLQTPDERRHDRLTNNYLAE